MKKFSWLIAIFITMAICMPAQAQIIEKRYENEDGTAYLTNAVSLFSGCKLRMCSYHFKDGRIAYGIGLDMTDRIDHVCKGNLLTIHFKDGSRISLSNLYDTKADVHQEHSISTQDHYHTDYIPVYDGWYDAFYAVPVETRYTTTTPVVRTTTFASLYYVVTPEQISKIAEGNVADMSIVTDSETIVKKARPLSRAVKELFPAVEVKK